MLSLRFRQLSWSCQFLLKEGKENASCISHHSVIISSGSHLFSYYLRKKTSLKVTHSTKERVLGQTWTMVETSDQEGRKLRGDSCLLSSSNWVECHLLPHSRLSLSAPDSKSSVSTHLVKPRPSQANKPAYGELSTLTFIEGKAWRQLHTQ